MEFKMKHVGWMCAIILAVLVLVLYVVTRKQNVELTDSSGATVYTGEIARVTRKKSDD